MSIKRFVAGTTSEALRKVRDALGSEAVILSNRATGEGVEILALAHADVTALILPEPEGAGRAARTAEKMSEKPAEKLPMREAGQRPSSTGPSSVKVPPARQGSGSESLSATGPSSGKVPAAPPTAETGLEKPRIQAPHATQTGRQAFNGNLRTGAAEVAAAVATMTESRRVPEPAADRLLTRNDSPEETRTGFSAKKKPFQRHSYPATRSAMENSGTNLARPEKQRDVRGLSRRAPVNVQGGRKHSSVNALRQVADEVTASVLREIKSMQGTLEQQLTTLTWSARERGNPVHGQIVRQLLAAGFGGALAHDLVGRLPEGIAENDALEQAKSLLVGNLQAIGNENEILEKGGVYALVGPTGVGKTTTTAKLAARCVLRHGADKVALLTTDGYRIGGHEQLRTYGKILGVAVHAVRDAQDLALALAELRGKHIVLIDTVGMSQRDQMVTEQAAMLAGCGEEVKRLVLLNAASNRHTLDEVAHAYSGNGLAGAIITKLDEAVVTGCVLDTAIRHRLPLYYVTCGQRVPEDMELANPASLVDGALENLPDGSAFAALEDEFMLSLPAHRGSGASLDMSEVHLG